MPFNPDDWEVVEPTVKIPGNPARNISVRQNNPFNLKGNVWGAIGVGTRGFAVYPTPEAGVEAGINQIQLDQSRGMTFGQFAEKYAPSYENPTWAADVSRALGGVPANMPISQIPTMALAQVIARRESSTDIGNWGKRASKIGATMPKKKFNPDDWEVVEEQPAAPQPVQTQQTKQQPQPSLPWQIAKGVGGAALTALDIPMKPVRAVKEAAIKQMMKVPALASEQEVPLEAMYPEVMAGRGSKGQTGITMKAPPLARTIGETGEILAMNPAYKVAGFLLRGARGLPYVREIPWFGRKAAQAAEVAPTGTAMNHSPLDLEDAIHAEFGKAIEATPSPSTIASKAPSKLPTEVPPAADVLPWETPSHRPQDLPHGGTMPELMTYGKGRGPVPSRDIWHERQMLTPKKIQDIAQGVSEKMGVGNPVVNQIIKQIQKLKELPPWQRYGVQ